MSFRSLWVGLLLSAAATFGQTQTFTTNLELYASVDNVPWEEFWENDPNEQELRLDEPTGIALARGQIAPGINRVYAHFESLNDANTELWADAWSYWTDEVLISDPDLNGTTGTFTANLRVTGSADFQMTGAYATGDAEIYGFWDTFIGTSQDGGDSWLVDGWFGQWFSDGMGGVFYEGDDLNQPLTEVTLEFVYGEPFLLRTNLEAYILAFNESGLPASVNSTLDFSHTAYWNGIGEFYDENGNPVTPDSFSSESGIDWRQPVPE